MEFLRSIPNKCFISDYDYNNSGFLIEIDPEVGKSLLKQSYETFPEISKFDVDIMQQFFTKNIAEIFNTKILEKIGNINEELKSALTKSFKETKIINSTVIQPQNQMCCLATFELHIGNDVGIINFQLNDCYLQLLRQANFFGFNWKQPEIQYLSSITSKRQENNLIVEFGRFNADRVQLEVGKIFIFISETHPTLRE